MVTLIGEVADDEKLSGELELRASDAERQRVAGDLREARVAGRLTLEEFSERLDLVYASRTRAELGPITRDLPAEAAAESGRRATRWSIAVLGGSSRRGRWRIEGKLRAVALLGGCELDLGKAEITGPEASITCISFLGGISIVVPDGVEVEVSGFSLLGGRDVDLGGERRRPGTPLIRIRGFAILGGLEVRSPERRLPN